LEPGTQRTYSEVTAVHESAHAVTSWILGYRVGIIQICQCGAGYCRHEKTASLDDDMVIGLAGAIAVIKKFGEEKASISDGDLKSYRNATEAERKLARSRAIEIVYKPEHWDLIEKLAYVLAMTGTLDAESLPSLKPSNP
jgi:hypothetical protein